MREIGAPDNYFTYLNQRRWSGKIYRKLWLYPILSRFLTGKVLDVGCGIGDFLSFRNNTIGVDINPHAVDLCRQKNLDAMVMQRDELPFLNQEFDGAVLDNVLEHIDEPGPVLYELHRVLRPEAALIVGVPGSIGYKRDSDHKKFYSEEKLVKTVTNCGFKLIKTFGMPLNSERLDTILSQYCIYGLFRRI